MAYFFLIVSIYLYHIQTIISTDVINCTVHDVYSADTDQANFEMSFDGMLNVGYEREGLAIYRYDNIKYVNLLLTDVGININGIFSKNEDNGIEFSLSLKTDIEGIALQNVILEHAAHLTECKLDIGKNVKYRNGVSLDIQNMIINIAQTCIQPKLCNQLNNVKDDDYTRALGIEYDFGENSAMFKTLGETYPFLNLPDPKYQNQNALQMTLNLLVDFWLASLVTKLSGKQVGQIDIPTVNETIPGTVMVKPGYFTIFNGTFGDLTTISRTKDVIVESKGIEFKADVTFQLFKAEIFSPYTIKYSVFNSNGNISIDIDNVNFTVRASLNYNKKPCQAKVTHIHFECGKIKFKIDKHSVFDSVLNKIVNKIVNKFTNKLLNFLEKKLKEMITSILDQFNCEQFRP